MDRPSLPGGPVSTESLVEALAPVVEALLHERPHGERGLRLSSAVRMAGGAINQNFLIELVDSDGQTQQWVLRRAQSRPVPGTHSRELEFRLFEFAHAVGLQVPEPIGLVEADGVTVSAFRRVHGEADPRAVAGWMKALLAQSEARALEAGTAFAQSCGEQLGRLHRASLGEHRQVIQRLLGAPLLSSVDAAMQGLRASLGLMQSPASYLRYAVEQLLGDAPGRSDQLPAVLCHNDFRLGNLMLTLHAQGQSPPIELVAVLDWEFAHWSDPMADLGWLTAPCWRFGGADAVGGIGPIEALVQGYAREYPEASLSLDELPYWQRFAQIRWALIAAQQGERALPGEPETLELRITGAMAASLAQPVVEHYLGHRVSPQPLPALQPQWGGARDLLQAAAQHLRGQMPDGLSSSARYASLMASNAIRLAYNHLLVQSVQHDNPEGNPVELDLAQDLAIWGFRGFP